ncbi:MAG: hypothetical protein IKJ84_02640 [Oscillospiraceae bacterium]|nr:hypothetical protein [Oscillospiraceae bacterium]
MKKQTLCKFLLILLPLAAVILTALPNAVVMRFYAGPNGYFLREVSGFSRTLVGYGQVFPGLAGICAGITVIFALRGPDRKRVRSFAAAGFVFWCLSSMVGGITWIGVGAAALLGVTAGIAHYLCEEKTV